MDPRPASTVMLLRDAPDGLEVFMLRRSAQSRFAPDAYVFPGGTVDESDRESLVDGALLKHLFRMEQPPPAELQRGVVAAAVRELREECGVRLAGAQDLELFSNWVTPESISPRYDVFFFVAAMPHGQTARADAVETHDGVWIAPSNALERGAAGGFYLIYPTIMHLARLRRFHSAGEVLAFARAKPVHTVLARGDVQTGFTLAPGLEDAW